MVTNRMLVVAVLIAATGFALASTGQTETPDTMHAKGSFDVTVEPQQPDNAAAKAAGVSRLSLDKRFHGELDAASQGEMLAIGDGSTSGAYVALEKVTGTLGGRSGSFALMHRSGLRAGIPENWSILIVPESGTEELAGIEGEMEITIEDGKHYYDLRYTLPDA
ncbi:MAG TPA: DUF3224 domain-containing protein [Woeseiaceae bacterium]|nr:DUF3224 domain-containing protein [Woeseiaceae bacterium]